MKINHGYMKTKTIFYGILIAVTLLLGVLVCSAQTNTYGTTYSKINITLNQGTYIITAYGASGGFSANGGVGGLGAEMQGEFNIAGGTTLTLLVGSAGSGQTYGGGGGGGSFVVESNTPLVIAGGGGGAGYSPGSGGNGGSGGIGTSGGGFGGGSGGGGGYSGNGSGGGYSGNGSGYGQSGYGNGGYSFINGGAGGYGGNFNCGNGGFGGGGGCGTSGGGGGGGYSGGGGGSSYGGGGGGGSIIDSSVFMIGTELTGVNGGDGQIVIIKISDYFSQAINFGTLSTVPANAAPFSLSATASSGLPVSYTSSNTNVATVSGNTVTIVSYGSTTITASQSGNATYLPATNVSQTLTVAGVTQTINFGALSTVPANAAPFSLSATASSGLPVSYTSSNTNVATVSGNTVTIVSYGSTTITASQAGNATYLPAANVSQALTVTGFSQTISFGALPIELANAAPFNLSATASSGLPVSYTSSNASVATVSGNTVTITGVGSTFITASQAGNAIYLPATNVSQTFTVANALRTLPGAYWPNIPFTVTVQCVPPADTIDYAVEDDVSYGDYTYGFYSYGNISGANNGGTVNQNSVKWGPFFDNSPRTLTYVVTPSAGLSNLFNFSGTLSINGVSQPIAGMTNVSFTPDYHPADNNPAVDSVMSLNEVTAYASAWKNSLSWPVAPNPIPINYMTQAGLLWKGGEYYVYVSSNTPPFCWVNATAPAPILNTIPAITATNAFRAMTNLYTVNVPFTVTLTITPATSVSVYAAEERILPGLTVTNLSTSGVFDPINKKIKWGPFFDNSSRTLSYQVIAPPTAPATLGFAGAVSFDGVATAIAGVQRTRSGAIVPPQLQPSAGFSNGQFTFAMLGSANDFYQIQKSTNLVNWSLLTSVINSNGMVLFTAPAATNGQPLFFRAIVMSNSVSDGSGGITYPISVSASPTNGGTVSAGGFFASGSSQTVTATATNGYIFDYWTENGTVVSPTTNYNFILTRSRNLVANFILPPVYYTIAVSASPGAGGSVGGGGTFVSGTSPTATATANNGYTFVNWTEGGTVVSSSASYNFTLTTNRTLVANFSPNYTLSVSASPGAGGSVGGGGTFVSGTSPTATATANSGYTFANWTEGGTVVSSSASYNFTLTTNRTLVANFTLNPGNYTIAVSASPGVGGTVGGGGAFANGSSQTVTATANSGYTFANWTEGGTVVSSSASYNFTLTANRTLVANFTPKPVNYTISVSASPGAGGSVGGGGTFANGSSQTVTATANSGYTFANWTEGGTVVSSSASYNFTLTTNRTLVANFTPNYTISVSASPSAGGLVFGGGNFVGGTSQTVTATANSGYTFANWTEGGTVVSSSASYNFTLTTNRTLVANFTPNGVTYTIVVEALPSAGGIVGGGGTFASGTSHTVTATANSGYTFANWADWTTGSGVVVSSSASYTFTLTGTRVLIATFTQNSGSGAGYDGTYTGPYTVTSPLGIANGIGTFTVVNGFFDDPTEPGVFSGNVDSNGNFTGNWYYSAGSLPIPMTGKFSTASSFILSGNIGNTVSGSFTLQKQ